MKYLAIDTSGKRLLVIAVNGEKRAVCDADCAMRHSVLLLPEIDRALGEVNLALSECDFIACVVGPGSFTGIRIGISTVKGLCMALDRPALALTSFEAIAYAERDKKKLALVDAGHDFYYACAFEGRERVTEPAYLSRAQVEELVKEGFAPLSAEPLGIESRIVSLESGVQAAVKIMKKNTVPASSLAALYLRKSSAEERR